MIKKSEVIICAVAVTGLLAYSVANQVDPLFASQTLAETALALTISGVKTVAYFGLQTAKSVGVVAGTYLTIKGTALAVSTLKNKFDQRFQKADIASDSENDDEFEEEFEEELEDDLESDQEEVLDELDLEELDEASENDLESDDDDEDYKPHFKADIAFTVDEDDALTAEEIECLLADQTRISFNFGEVKVSELTPIKTTCQAGPYALRPRK